jgi:hypothetical protein
VDHTEKVILEKNDGFVTQIMRPSFLKPDEIVFQGRGPENRELNRVVTRLVDVSVIAVAYHLKFGAQPEILGPGTGKEKYSADTFT